MDATHIHLLLNHFPIIGTLIGTAVMFWGLLRSQKTVKAVASVIIVAMTLMAVPVYLTGEPTEERVENLPGFSETYIEEHEDAAKTAMIAMVVAGIAALAALIMQYRSSSKIPFVVAMGLAILACATMALTGYYGGQIRHSELRQDQQAIQHTGEYENDDD